MNIQQKSVFQPITLTLETAQETEWLWDLVERELEEVRPLLEQQQRDFYRSLSNWFSSEAAANTRSCNHRGARKVIHTGARYPELKAHLHGTRIPVKAVVGFILDGCGNEEIMRNYPSLNINDTYRGKQG